MKKAFILDISAFLHRGYYAYPDLRAEDGTPTGGLYFFMSKFLEILNTFGKPDIIIAAMDSKSMELERKQIYADYKSGRPEKPDDLKIQFEIFKGLANMLGMFVIEIPGHEADDIIGTYSRFFSIENIESYMFTTDKDMAQLCVNDLVKHVLVLKTTNAKDKEKFKVITKDTVKDFIGVEAQQIPDLFGLIGDAADAIPGVNGVGEKTGEKLIQEYGILENIYANIEQIKGKMKEKLIADKDNAFLSRKLATINTQLKIVEDLNSLWWKGFDFVATEHLLHSLQMHKTFMNFKTTFEFLKDTMTQEVYDLMCKIDENVFIAHFHHTGTEWEICLYQQEWNIFDRYTDIEFLEKAKYKCVKYKSPNIISAINHVLKEWDLGKIYKMPFYYSNLSFDQMKDEMLRVKTQLILCKGGQK